MLADPQSVTTDAAHSLPRSGTGIDSGVFQNAADGYTFAINHSYSNSRARHVVRLNQRKIVTDPLFSTQNKQVEATATVTINSPVSGFTDTELKNLVKGLVNNLLASSDANLIKVIGRES